MFLSTATTCRSLPLLLEWDIAHGCTDQLRVTAVAKVSGKKGEADPASWRYLLEEECVKPLRPQR